MFIDMVIMDMMQVPIVKIVGVTLVCHSGMSAVTVVSMTVRAVLFAGFIHRIDLRSNQTRPTFKKI
jgi:hypothetical protein